MRRTLAALAAIAMMVVLIPSPARGLYLPLPDGKFGSLGDNIYNTTGHNQTKQVAMKAGGSKQINFQAQNDAVGPDDLYLDGDGNEGKIIVHYSDSGGDQTTNVENFLYHTGTIAAGASVDLTITLKAKSSASSGERESFAIDVYTTLTKGVYDEIKVKARVR